MSLILDALKRAERERQTGGPALGELPAPSERRRRRGVPWRLILLVLVAAVIGAVGWKVTHRPRPAVIARAAPPPAPRPQPQVTQPATPTPIPPHPPMQTRPVPTPIPGTEGVSSLDEVAPNEGELEPPAPVPMAPPAAKSQAPTASKPAPAATPAPAPQPQSQPQQQAAAPAPAAKPAPQPEEPIKEEPAAPPEPQAKVAEPPREIPPALTQQAPLRKLREMPPEYRADFPALTVQVHNYESQAAQRFVIVNDHRYREGERLAEGPQIIEIVRDGMVLDYRGERVLFTLNR